ncbi:HDOD domain-containing protein [Chrysiogenes arsenatis]|uniref:HDOD domain-containing protein n=1 Tax=Chrysiogenes arsenatis TaxID=309797 RepID=UPI0003FA0324|nr:HDOD domain-containing protein [Chrysiogenes arsenatis]
MSRLSEIIQVTDSFPSPSGVIAEIIEVLGDPKANFQKIANSISTDPNLSGKVVGMANSAFYARGSECTTVQNAIMRIGMDSLSGLVLGTFAGQVISNDPELETRLKSFWEHSLCVAVLGKSIGARLAIPFADLGYVAGILHDIGKMGMFLVDREKYSQMLAESKGSEEELCRLELAEFGVDHAEAGSYIATKWKLPAGIQAAITYHHTVSQIPKEFSRYASLIAVTALSNDIAHQIASSLYQTTIVWSPDPVALDLLGIDEPFSAGLIEAHRNLAEKVTSLVSELI